MTLNELLSARDAAGQRYAAAVGQLQAALIELGGIDAALAAGAGGFDGGPDVRSFHDLPQNLGTLAHPVFAPADLLTDWNDEIKARRDELIKELSK
jgi:hypothetical protein